MKCPECEFENPSGSRFCRNCGSPLPREAESLDLNFGEMQEVPPQDDVASSDTLGVPRPAAGTYVEAQQRQVEWQQAEQIPARTQAMPPYATPSANPVVPASAPQQSAPRRSAALPLAIAATALLCCILCVLVFGGFVGRFLGGRESESTVSSDFGSADEASVSSTIDTGAQEAEEEAQRQAEEEAQRDDTRRAGMLASMDGWWNAAFQGTTCAYISNGSFYIYREDITKGRLFRTIVASDLVRYDDGLPLGPFAGKPGYLIPRYVEGDKNYYITDEDYEDGSIDQISHVNDDGSGYEEDQTFYRCTKPSYAE